MLKMDMVQEKMGKVKEVAKPLLDHAKKEPGMVMKMAMVGMALLAFMKMSSSVSGLCDAIKSSKSK